MAGDEQTGGRDGALFDALQAARSAIDAATAPSGHEAAPMRTTLDGHVRSLWRRRALAGTAIAAVLMVLAGNVALHPLGSQSCAQLTRADLLAIGAVPAAALIASLVLVGRRGAGAQLLTRAFWWSNLVGGSLSTLGSPGLLPLAFPAAALGCGAALLLLGDRGLEIASDPGRTPTLAYRGALALMLVLAAADGQLLLAVAVSNRFLRPAEPAFALLELACVVGLTRFARAALPLSLATNLALVATVVTGHFEGLPEPLRTVVAVSAFGQATLVVALRFAVRRDPSGDDARLRGLARPLARAVMLALMALAAVVAIRGPDPAHLQRYCAAQTGAL
jgi:hypothetical protein